MLKVVITESQKKLLIESVSDDIKNIQEQSIELTKKILSDTKKQTGVNLEMLLTWGASIGGFMSPVTQWLQGKNPELSDMDISLITTAVVCVIFYQNKQVISKLSEEIKERGLTDLFRLALKKSKDLEKVLLNFMNSLNITTFNLLSMLSYAFLVPLLPMIFDMVHNNHFTSHDVEMVAKSIAGFGMVTTGSNLLKNLLTKIFKRFSKEK